MKRTFIFCALLFVFTWITAQDKMVDSLKLELAKAKTDTAKIHLRFLIGEASAIMRLGYWDTMAIDAHKAGLKKIETNSLNNCGFVANNRGRIKEALDYFLRCLKLQEEQNDAAGVGSTYSSLGIIAEGQGNYTEAKEYAKKGLEWRQKGHDTAGIANSLYNIGSTFLAESKFDEAIDYLLQSLKLFEKIGSKHGMAYAYGNLGTAYNEKKDFKQALDYQQKSYELRLEINDKHGLVNSMENMGLTYSKLGDLKKAEELGLKAMGLAKNELYPETILRCANLLYEVYKKQGKYNKALEYYELVAIMKDSINNEDNKSASLKSKLKYDFDKKAAQDSVRVAEEKKVNAARLEASEAKLKQEKTTRYALFGGLALVILFSGFLYNRFRITQKQKNIIEHQKNEVEKQKEIVEEKQKEILDSITYAKRLQDAILPADNYWHRYLPESFILYQPKDIVAGDFYWMESLPGDNSPMLIAAADCTGHGVPGAMVSVVCSNAMNRAVKEFHITEPGKILDKVRDLVIETFEKSQSEVKDGMDISLVKIELIPESNKLQKGKLVIPKGQSLSDVIESKKRYTIEWAGANNPLWYFSDGELKEIKSDKQPIGKYSEQKAFTTHTLELAKGDCIYLFTDGIADQFGGPKGKKFKYRQLKDILQANHALSMNDQQKFLQSAFDNWKSSLEQVDDVCVIGVRI